MSSTLASKAVFVLTQRLQDAFKPGTAPATPTFDVRNKQEKSMLFRLPAELRNKVYALALGPNYSDTCIRTHSSSTIVDLEQASAAKPTRALLISCSRIYNEAHDISIQAQRDFWKTNTFFVELRQDWTTEDAQISDSALALQSTKPMLDFPTIERCEILSIPDLIVFVDSGTYKCELLLKGNDGKTGNWNLHLAGTTAGREDMMAYVKSLPKEHSAKLKHYAALESKFKAVEKYAKLAASYFSTVARPRRLSTKEEHFAELLEASPKPYRAQEGEWDLLLNPNRVLLRGVLKIMHQNHKVLRKPQLALG